MNSKELAFTIADFILQKKGSHIVVMDLKKLTTVTDFFVICSVTSDTQVKTISDYVNFIILKDFGQMQRSRKLRTNKKCPASGLKYFLQTEIRTESVLK